MDFDFFKAVGDYPKMLNKIALSTFVGTILAVWLLRHELHALDIYLSPFSVPIQVAGGISIPFGTILPAFVVAALSRIFKLHDRLSDMLRIRQRFDVSEILFPMAIASGASLSGEQIRAIKKNREAMMYKVFYKYASSTKGKAVIDSHYITMALDQWSWYWIVLEQTFLACVLASTFWIAGRYSLAATFLAVALVAIAVLQGIRSLCSDYALQQVEQILGASQRKLEVAEAFRAL
jgi:hypothetical protein